MALDDAQHVALAGRDEEDGVAGAARPARASDAMRVGFRIVRNVVVDDVRDALHVDAARGHIGGDHDIQLPVLQAGNGTFTLRLRNIPVQLRGIEAARTQFLGKIGGLKLGAHEHQHGIEALRFEHAGQRIQLVQAADQPVALADQRRGAGLLPDRDLDRVAHVLLGDTADGIRHGGREQRDLRGPAGSASGSTRCRR